MGSFETAGPSNSRRETGDKPYLTKQRPETSDKASGSQSIEKSERPEIPAKIDRIIKDYNAHSEKISSLIPEISNCHSYIQRVLIRWCDLKPEDDLVSKIVVSKIDINVQMKRISALPKSVGKDTFETVTNRAIAEYSKFNVRFYRFFGYRGNKIKALEKYVSNKGAESSFTEEYKEKMETLVAALKAVEAQKDNMLKKCSLPEPPPKNEGYLEHERIKEAIIGFDRIHTITKQALLNSFYIHSARDDYGPPHGISEYMESRNFCVILLSVAFNGIAICKISMR